MVKITIDGRVMDGLPLAQGPRYVNEENGSSFLCYKQQGEFILKEISRGALIPSKMTIRIDHHSLNYLIGNGVCFMALCDSSYPRKLAFHYLQDLQKEFEKFDNSVVGKITRPYSFVKFGNLCSPTLLVRCYICMENWELWCSWYAQKSLAITLGLFFLLSNLYSKWLADGVIGSIRKQYIDTRTQANLSKLNANREKELEIVTENISEILHRKRNSEISERLPATTPEPASAIWGSPLLEVIALKWTPITAIVAVAAILLWASLVLKDDFII